MNAGSALCARCFYTQRRQEVAWQLSWKPWERALSQPAGSSNEGVYGTRSCTLPGSRVLVEQDRHGLGLTEPMEARKNNI